MSSGYELPSRLAIAAADCCLAITYALTRKDDILKDKIRLSDSNKSKESVPSLPGIGHKKVKEIQNISKIGMETLLWNQLPELINLVQRLLTVCIHIFQLSFLSFCFNFLDDDNKLEKISLM